MFRRRNKILIIDPSFLRYQGNNQRLKILKNRGWIIIVAPVGAIKFWEGK